MRKGTKISIIILLPFVLAYMLLFRPIRYVGGQEGRVVDAETGKPLEGVVVVGVWYTFSIGDWSSYYDSRETVTDKNGEFRIPGLGITMTFLCALDEIHILIFKAGYEEVGPMRWISFRIDESYERTVKWEGSKVIVPLRKMSLKERRGHHFTTPSGPPESHKQLLFEIDKERKQVMFEIDKDEKGVFWIPPPR